MMEGFGSVQIIMDPDPGGPKSSGSGSTTLLYSKYVPTPVDGVLMQKIKYLEDPINFLK